MWIVPKNLHTSHFALDTEALTSDYNALSELCAQSLLVRSSPTLARTWLRKWKQDSWTQHLFGRILKPSHGASFAEKWTSCQVASLVSPSAPLAPVEETRTPDTCSPTSSEDSESWADLPLFSSKMWKESLAPSSQETRGQTPKALPFCSMSSASWSEWVTRSRQEYSARLKWAQHTNASASLFLESAQTLRQGGASLSTGSWNTPRVGLAHAPSGGGNPHSAEFHLRLENQVQMDQPWPTPSTQETPHYEITLTATGRRAGSKHPITRGQMMICNDPLLRVGLVQDGQRDEEPNSTLGSLHESPQKAIAWGTPRTRDHIDANIHQRLTPRQSGEERLDTLPRQALDQEMYKGTLNPRWVETLMGLPVGWTMPSCACPVTPWLMSYASSGTEWSQQQQSEPSVSCGHSSTPLEDEEDEGY